MGFASLNPSYEGKDGCRPPENSSTKAHRREWPFAIFLLITSQKIYCSGGEGLALDWRAHDLLAGKPQRGAPRGFERAQPRFRIRDVIARDRHHAPGAWPIESGTP